MTEDVSSVRSERIDRTTRTPEKTLDTKEEDAIRGAANAVQPTQIAATLGVGDGYEPGTGDRNKVAGPSPVQSAMSLPIGAFVGTGSPISSSDTVRRMGELGALGNGAAARFDRSQYSDLRTDDPGAPFTGSGATGISPTRGAIPVGDLAALARYDQGERDLRALRAQREQIEQAGFNRPPGISDSMEQRRQEIVNNQLRLNRGNIEMTNRVMDALQPTVDSYKNPLSENPAVSGDPKDLFDEQTRTRQAQLLLNQPISTIHGDAYGDRIPTRAEVISAAAAKYNLDPAVLSGVILHEQRDQSQKEDAADFGGATLAGRDTSIGLGQILMSTGTRNNAELLSDTVDPETRANLSRNDVARLLTSDEHNIYATARYLRSVADQGAAAGSDPAALPNTRRDFPGIDFSQYAGSNWSDANIRAIASEYTSRPWDDRNVTPDGYPQFVLDAVNDVRRSGVFNR